jgi:hypothetical protein
MHEISDAHYSIGASFKLRPTSYTVLPSLWILKLARCDDNDDAISDDPLHMIITNLTICTLLNLT